MNCGWLTDFFSSISDCRVLMISDLWIISEALHSEYWHQRGVTSWPQGHLTPPGSEITVTARVCCVYLLSLLSQLILELPDLWPLQLHLVSAVLAQAPAAVLQLSQAELVLGAELSLQPLRLNERRTEASETRSHDTLSEDHQTHLHLSVSQRLLSLLQIRQSLLQLLLQNIILHLLKNNIKNYYNIIYTFLKNKLFIII